MAITNPYVSTVSNPIGATFIPSTALADGDIVLVAVMGGKDANSIPDVAGDAPKFTDAAATPTTYDFTLLDYSTNGDAMLSVWWRKWTTSMGSSNRITSGTGYGGSGGQKCTVSVYTGADDVLTGASNTGSGNVTWSLVAVPTGSTNFIQVGFVGWSRNTTFTNASPTSPPPYSFVIDAQLSGTGGDGTIGMMQDLDTGTTIATGLSCTAPGGRDWVSWHIAFRAGATGTAVALASSTVGTSTTSASLSASQAVALASSTASTSTTSAALTSGQAVTLAASTVSTSVTSAALSASQAVTLASSTVGTSTTSAAMTAGQAVALASSTVGISTVSADLTSFAGVSLAASTVSTSVTSAALSASQAVALASSTVGTSTTSAALSASQAVALASSTVGTSTVSADLTSFAGVSLAASTVSTSVTSAALSASQAVTLASSTVGTSTTSASLSSGQGVALSASTVGISTTSASLSASQVVALTASTTGSSTVAAELTSDLVAVRFSASVTGTSGSTAAVSASQARALAASAIGTSTLTAALVIVTAEPLLKLGVKSLLEKAQLTEEITYYPGGDLSAGVVIRAVVVREELDYSDYGEFGSPTMDVSLYISTQATNGIATVAAGKDLADVVVIEGESAVRVRITEVVERDPAMAQLVGVR